MRALTLLVTALLLLVAPLGAAAIDAPHDASFTTGGCMACHRLHNALGQALTSQVTISDACQTCHTAAAAGNPNHPLGFPWGDTDQAVRGVSGVHHRWDATAISAPAGATTPNDTEMQQRLVAGRLECSVCHNQHAANKAFVPPTRMRTSYAIGAPQVETNVGGGTATLTILSADAANAEAKGYLVRTTAANLVAISHDNGVSWFRPQALGGPWIADVATPAGGPFTPGSPLTLDDPAIRIQITAGAAAGDTWRFYVAFPFMRALNLAGETCLACHQERNLTHADIEGGGDGTRLFSHPVGVALNANTQGYDRLIPLDADGGVQGVSGDTNATNDLELGAGSIVGCTSCHAAHNADSNSQTVDKR